jgi:hypothetical protein
LLLSPQISANYSPIDDGKSLAFVMDIFRHGARSPSKIDDPKYFHQGKGELTNSGMRQHDVLGKI